MNRRRLLVLPLLLCLRPPSLLLAQLTAPDSKSRAATTTSCSSNPVQQWYDRKFQRLAGELSHVASASNSQASVQAAVLERIYDLRDTVSDPKVVDSFIEAAAENRALSPLARAEAAFLAIQVALHQGDFQRITSRYAALGYFRKWRIVGEEFPIDATAANWKEFALGPTPWLEIGEDLWPEASYVTLETSFDAASEQAAALRLSSEGPAIVYLNSVPVLRVSAAGPHYAL